MPGRRVGLRPWPRSVRSRTTFVAIATVSVALLIGAIVLITILRTSLRNSVDRAAIARAQDVATLVRSGSLPPRLAFPGGESAIIQVVDPHGAVIASTSNLDRQPPILLTSGTDPATVVSLRSTAVEDFQRFRVAALGVLTSEGTTTIYAGESTDRADDTVTTITLLLLGGTPVLILIVGVVTWRNARRALAPVHRIIAEVDAITDGSIHARIEPPGTEDEVDELATTMNAMLDRLDRFTERQRRFTGDASHELRSPLASLRTQIEVAVAHPEGVDIAVIGGELLADVDRLERLASDLLELARLDAATIQHSSIDLREVVTDAVAATPSARSIRYRTDLRSAPAVVEGDRRQLIRVLRNLLENADRYAASMVEVRLGETSTHWVLEVIDDGPGIPSDDTKRVFERFTRLDNSRVNDHGGAGLGLAIVKEIVEAHHGEVDVGLPETGSGACFSIKLPKGHED
jgi:signal transduction histidine kinase